MIEMNKILFGKCDEVLKGFADHSFDSCVTDPPYGISFMNKHWDYDVPKVELWKEVFRVLKPGAHMLVACGTRTQHRMVVNIEDAGFEIRDVISWIYGSGFPKSLDISKAIDKAAGADREIIGTNPNKRPNAPQNQKDADKTAWQDRGSHNITTAATEAAKQWEGWGTALKPATEFWTLARKPISENTIAENVLKCGTGAININAGRVPFVNEQDKDSAVWGRGTDILSGNYVGAIHGNGKENIEPNEKGRFPANVIFDEFTGKILDEQTGTLTSGLMKQQIEGGQFNVYGKQYPREVETIGDSGGASRFFYCPKADGYERNKGLQNFDEKRVSYMNTQNGDADKGKEWEPIDDRTGKERNRFAATVKNNHPTVKPIDLMRYLVKLITPKKGIVLDPFCGSGTTCIGAKLELINYVGIEMVEEYCKIADARVAAWNPQKYIEQKLF